jgi:hypothetical protein
MATKAGQWPLELTLMGKRGGPIYPLQIPVTYSPFYRIRHGEKQPIA